MRRDRLVVHQEMLVWANKDHSSDGQTLANDSEIGECKGMKQDLKEIVEDASCFEGVLIRSSIDLSETGFRHINNRRCVGNSLLILTQLIDGDMVLWSLMHLQL